jgi:hypothetical protein
VKRALLLAIASLLVAGHALGYVPHFPLREVTVSIGERIDVPVHAAWSGLLVSWNYYHWEFISADERIAKVAGVLQSPDTDGTISVTGVEAGDTSARIAPQGDWPWLIVHVVCGFEPPVIPAKPVITSLQGQVVSIQAITPVAPRAVFQWYAGRIGDHSHPITVGGGPELRLLTDTVGANYVWVVVRTPCSESKAEFRIDVAPIRRRSTGQRS